MVKILASASFYDICLRQECIPYLVLQSMSTLHLKLVFNACSERENKGVCVLCILAICILPLNVDVYRLQ